MFIYLSLLFWLVDSLVASSEYPKILVNGVFISWDILAIIVFCFCFSSSNFPTSSTKSFCKKSTLLRTFLFLGKIPSLYFEKSLDSWLKGSNIFLLAPIIPSTQSITIIISSYIKKSNTVVPPNMSFFYDMVNR